MKPVARNKRWSLPFLVAFLSGLFCLAILMTAGPVSAATYYVRTGGTGDGTSWDTASSDLAGILNDVVVSGDQIWVAQGEYRPTTNSSDRGASFELQSGVALYGGFPKTGDPDSGDRDPATYVTVLTGDIDSNDSVDQYGVVVSADLIVASNSYHVVYANGVDDTAVLDGFVVTGGKADGTTADLYGGGMYNYYSSSAVTNCTFSGNEAYHGGGMYNDYSNPAVTNCTFSGNSASYGGGMYNYYSSSAVTNCTFSANEVTTWGGGMVNYYSSPTMTNCTFSGNTADDSGGGMRNTVSSPAVTNCTFSGNETDYGGGMYNDYSSPTMTNCTFSGNSAKYGGGMDNVSCSPAVTNCIFWDNLSSNEFNEFGGDSPTLSYCLVRNGDVAVLYANDTPVASGDLALQPLADNGGPTMTCALGTGSIAIDAGLASLDIEGDFPDLGNVVPSSDQRGVTRPKGYGYDIGAYEAEWHFVTVSTDIGGTVSVEPYGVILSGDMTSVSKDFPAYDTPTFVITPEESMDLTGVWLDSEDVSFDVMGATVTFDPLSCDHTLEAKFAVRTFSIDTTAVGSGAVTVSPDVVDWGGSFTVIVSADAHHHIASITVDAASVDVDLGVTTWSTTFDNVSSDHGVSADFAIDTHTLSVGDAGTGSGNVTLSPSGGTYDWNTSVTLTALPETSSVFTGWSGVDSSSGSTATVNMTGDKSVTATFSLRTFDITATAGAGGTVSPSGTTSVSWDGSLIVNITPYHGYAVSDVVVDGVSQGVATRYPFERVREDHTLQASFVQDQAELDQGGVSLFNFPGFGNAADALIAGTASVDLPAGLPCDSFNPVVSADLGDFWLDAVDSGDFDTEAVSADPGGTFLCGVSFDVEASQGTGVGLLAMDLQLSVPESALSTACLEAIATDEEEVGLTEAFLSRVSLLKVFSDDVYDLFGVALDSQADPLDFFTLSRDEDSFLVGLGLLIADTAAKSVDAVQAVPASGDCRFLVFDGIADGHFRDPLVVVEKDLSTGDSGCNVLPVSGLVLLMLPLLGLLKKR